MKAPDLAARYDVSTQTIPQGMIWLASICNKVLI
jgi:hypothetical protein